MKTPAKSILTITVTVAYTLILTSLFVSLINTNQNIRLFNIGTIRVVGFQIYGGNVTTTNGNYTIDWGITYVGASTNRSFYIRSKGNVNTRMDLTSENWTFRDAEEQAVQPPQSNPIKITSDYNETFSPDQEIYLTLTLDIPYEPDFVEYLIDNKIQAFAFDIIIQPSHVSV